MDEAELKAQLEMLHRESFGWALACAGRDPLEAEGVLQSVYLKILDGRARFEGRSSFKTWLFAVIRLTARERRRRQLLSRFRLLPYDALTGHSHQDSQNESVYQTEIQRIFRNALAKLPARQRETLHLVFYHDLSLTEAAEVMKVSVGSARTHYERGKARLRKLLEETEAFNELDGRRQRHTGPIR